MALWLLVSSAEKGGGEGGREEEGEGRGGGVSSGGRDSVDIAEGIQIVDEQKEDTLGSQAMSQLGSSLAWGLAVHA